ncbi:MAG: peptidase M16 domain-containing protein, partial [Parcubacteria group bacterium Gr01-1014_66]
GLAYTVWSAHESYSNRGYLITYAGVDHPNVEKTIRAALEEYKNICTSPVGVDELKRVKDYIRGTTLISLEQSNAVASFVGAEEMLTGNPLTTDEVFAKLDAVTANDICAVAQKIITPASLNLAMIGPWKDETVFQKIITEW